jgi:tetratricopeptide (TPR) repeat protein
MAASASQPFSFGQILARLHRQVRLGNFVDSQALAEECWRDRHLADSEHLRLRTHSLCWEVFDALGESGRAFSFLREDDIDRTCLQLIELANKRPEEFRREQFPSGGSKTERRQIYRLWRQRIFVVMAAGMTAYRDQLLLRADHILNEANTFVYKCLIPSGFECNGTRARLHFFLGLLSQRRHLLAAAANHFDKALEFCFGRLNERILDQTQPQDHEIERAFANYCLGKLHICVGELEFDQGRLKAARRHLVSGKLLVCATQDTFLLFRADLLLCRIARSDEQFVLQGWALLKLFANCRLGLERHPVYRIEAAIEEVTTAVYLHRAGKNIPGSPPRGRLASIDQALEEITKLIQGASTARLQHTQFHAMLVRARILIRLHREEEARSAIDDALGLFPSEGPPAALLAEASFVRAKTHSSQGNFQTALRYFREALTAGHESQVFQTSCHLQVLEMLIRGRHHVEARNYLSSCDEILRDIESSFLHARFDELRQILDAGSTITFDFDSKFDLNDAKDQLERFYVRNLARLLDRPPGEILKPSFWRELVKKHNIDDTRRRIKALLAKHYPPRRR